MDRLISRRTMFAGSGKYIKFADPEVERICIANWSSDGIGLTYEDAAAVTSLWNVFSGNTSIVSFDELQYFNGLSVISSFQGCSNLSSIGIPKNVGRINKECFDNCVLLLSVKIEDLSDWCKISFENTKANPSCHRDGNQQTNSATMCINGTAIVNLVIPNDVSIVKDDAFARYNFQTIELHSGVTQVGKQAFSYSRTIEKVISRAPTPPVVTAKGRYDVEFLDYNSGNLKIYVPYSSDHSILNAYKVAYGWSTYASQIYELNPDGSIPQN